MRAPEHVRRAQRVFSVPMPLHLQLLLLPTSS